jgi:hypothetical protein
MKWNIYIGISLFVIGIQFACNAHAYQYVDKVLAWDSTYQARSNENQQNIDKTMPLSGKEQTQQSRQKEQKKKYYPRIDKDKSKYGIKAFQDAETIHLTLQQNPTSPQAKEILRQLVTQYPQMNFTGTAFLTMAEKQSGSAKEEALREAIEKYNDCYYIDGVQVGAYARYLLVLHYRNTGKKSSADAIMNQIKQYFPEAIDHQGNLLIEH